MHNPNPMEIIQTRGSKNLPLRILAATDWSRSGINLSEPDFHDFHCQDLDPFWITIFVGSASNGIKKNTQDQCSQTSFQPLLT